MVEDAVLYRMKCEEPVGNALLPPMLLPVIPPCLNLRLAKCQEEDSPSKKKVTSFPFHQFLEGRQQDGDRRTYTGGNEDVRSFPDGLK